jgi:DNA polymerase-3 subunit beta
MNFSTTTKQLLNAVLMCEKIVGKKESLPVLSCIVFESKKNTVTIQATNLESTIKSVIPAQVTTEGIIAIPAHVLSQTLRSIQGESITCMVEDENFVIKSQKSHSVIKSIPHTEFPLLHSETTVLDTNTIQKDTLLSGIRSVVYAASPSMIRPELGSVCILSNDSDFICVATDSFRLAEKTIKQASVVENTEILIPLKYTLELLHVLEHIEEDSIEWKVVEDSYIVFQGPRLYYSTRVVDGHFPQYKEIIPKDTNTEVVILKDDFTDALRKARIFSGVEQCVGFHVYPSRKIFTITAQSNEIGEMSDSVDAAITGEDIDIKFHISYLADCLSSIASDSITLTFAGVGRPVVIKGVSDASFRYLVMPLNR